MTETSAMSEWPAHLPRGCPRAGVRDTLEHLEEVRRVSPRRRGDRIARASLGSEHGRIAHTGAPGHYSLWFHGQFHAEAHRLFEVVA